MYLHFHLFLSIVPTSVLFCSSLYATTITSLLVEVSLHSHFFIDLTYTLTYMHAHIHDMLMYVSIYTSIRGRAMWLYDGAECHANLLVQRVMKYVRAL